MHQLAEYVIGFGLIAAGFQSVEPLWPVLAGGLVVVSTALVDGPLGAWRAVTRHQHRRLDPVLAIALFVLAVLPFVDIDVASRIMIGGAGVVWLVVWKGSNYETAKTNRARRSAVRQQAAGDRSEAIGRSAAKLVNQGRAYWRKRQDSN